MTVPAIYETMTVPAPDVPAKTAEALARVHWGITAKASPQTGERDRNFHMYADDGREFVFKIANAAEDPGFRDMQIQTLAHIARTDPTLPVPRVMPTRDGATQITVPGSELQARLLSWVPGVPIHESRRTAAQRRSFGAALARLQLALADFHHEADHHEVSWDVQHALHLRAITFAIPDPVCRHAIEAVFDEFEAQITPLIPILRRQAAHNDLNHNNTLVDPANHDRIAGIIDFGDMAKTYIAVDIATAAVTQPAPDMPAPDAIAHFLAGYREIRPLPEHEAALLPILMATRVALATTLSCWHRYAQPDNPHYDISEPVMARRLAAMASYQTPEMLKAVMKT